MQLIVLLILFLHPDARAYPEFIGYGYSSCITCHYNGNGSGSLTEYGRAVWASEIAGRAFAGQTSPEKLAERSNFLFGAKEPWWLKPSVKSRIINYVTNPGSDSTSDSRTIVMQAEANLALLFDKNANKALVLNYGYIPDPQEGVPREGGNWMSREHYFRWQMKKDLWLYLGLMPKVYGVRVVDHTAFSRSATGNGQNDQSHGVVVQYVKPKWEISLNSFFGNYTDAAEDRPKGFSGMTEFELADDWRLGLSILSSNGEDSSSFLLGLHSRWGLGKGNSILAEIGTMKRTYLVGLTEHEVDSVYVFTEATQKLFRGYHLFVTAQGYQPQANGPLDYTVQFAAGFVAFPLQRLEFRIEARNTREISSTSTQADSWTALGQVHVSL